MSDDLAARAVLVVVMVGTCVAVPATARAAADRPPRRNGLAGIRTVAAPSGVTARRQRPARSGAVRGPGA